MCHQPCGHGSNIDGAAVTARQRTITNHAASHDPRADEPIADDEQRLRIMAPAARDAPDPVRYWSLFDGDRRIGRICLICLPDHVGAVLGLWAEQGHALESTARGMLIDAVRRGLYRAACVKVITDASVADEPAWAQIIANRSLTPRPGRANCRWREYYVNIYHWRDENAGETRCDRAHLPTAGRKRLRAGAGAPWGKTPPLSTRNDDARSLGGSGYIERRHP